MRSKVATFRYIHCSLVNCCLATYKRLWRFSKRLKLFSMPFIEFCKFYGLFWFHIAEAWDCAVVNISSVQAHRAKPYHSGWPYQANKAAVTTMSKCMALDLSAHGIRVNSICPGYIWTEHVMLHMLLVFLFKPVIKSIVLSFVRSPFIHSFFPSLLLVPSFPSGERDVFCKVVYQNKRNSKSQTLFILNWYYHTFFLLLVFLVVESHVDELSSKGSRDKWWTIFQSSLQPGLKPRVPSSPGSFFFPLIPGQHQLRPRVFPLFWMMLWNRGSRGLLIWSRNPLWWVAKFRFCVFLGFWNEDPGVSASFGYPGILSFAELHFSWP